MKDDKNKSKVAGNEVKTKRKKEKITCIDDGRTISDMSSVSGGSTFSKKGTVASPKEIWSTYWNAVKMMFKPMLVVIGFLIAVYVIAAIMLSTM